jgi:DNA-binding transcriptional MerR regulator
MAETFLRMIEVTEICRVDEDFVLRLERESLITPVVQDSQKLYSLEQVDRIRVARLLIEELGVNLEGTEVALNLREQMIAMQRQLGELFRRLSQERKK